VIFCCGFAQEVTSAMNKIIRENYPAARLPDDLRTGLDPTAKVTVTVTLEERRPEHVLSLEEIWALRRPPFRSMDEIDTELRQLREEWNE
jgi:hypothetical protein